MKPQFWDKVWEAGLALVIAAGIASGVISLSGCTPKRTSPTLHYNSSGVDAAIQASAIHRVSYRVAPTGSMMPFLQGGDFVVVDTRFPYEKLAVGDLVNYQARWLPADFPTVTHWTASKTGNEWIMDGQANAHYENTKPYLMGVNEFRGKVTDIYTTRSR